jgi:hypothetical protein
MANGQTEEPPLGKIGFAFGIRPRLNPDGSIASYDVQAQNFGLPDETVITLVRNWLRVVEDNYYNKFKGATQVGQHTGKGPHDA